MVYRWVCCKTLVFLVKLIVREMGSLDPLWTVASTEIQISMTDICQSWLNVAQRWGDLSSVLVKQTDATSKLWGSQGGHGS